MAPAAPCFGEPFREPLLSSAVSTKVTSQALPTGSRPPFRALRHVGLLALALVATQVVTWAAWGRTHLSDELPIAVSRDFAYIRRFMERYWPSRATAPPFPVLVLPPELAHGHMGARLRNVLTRWGVASADASSARGELVLSCSTSLNTPVVGALVTSYNTAGAGVSMRTTFFFVLGAWIPGRTVQLSVS